MNLTNAKVALSYSVTGAHLLYGEYKYFEKNQKGELLPENNRLRIKKQPVESDCRIVITLGEQFVNHAISVKGIPYGEKYYKTAKAWKHLSDEQKLNFHVSKYVEDVGGKEFSYSVIPE